MLISSLKFLELSHSFELPVFETELPWVLNQVIVDDIGVKIQNEEILFFKSRDLKRVLESTLTSESFQDINFLEEWIPPEAIPFEVHFSPQDLTLTALIDQSMLKPAYYSLARLPDPLMIRQAYHPALWGGAINYQVERKFGDTKLSGEKMYAFFDSFLNMNSLVLESELSYRELGDGTNKWFRGDTRLLKDFPNQRIRAEVGDIYPRSFGLMQTRPLGGLQISRQFSLNPYRVPFSQGSASFTLNTRSQVKTYVNGMLIRNEMLPPGVYNLEDLPLANGINSIRVEVIDDSGREQVYEYSLPTSTSLLRENEWNFAIASGSPVQNDLFNRSYDSKNTTHFFAQYGLTPYLTLGAYNKLESDYLLIGQESGLSTGAGNVFFGLAYSELEENEKTSGWGKALTWQLQRQAGFFLPQHTLTLRHERFGADFRRQASDNLQNLFYRTQGNITLPVTRRLSASLGGEVSRFYHNDKKGQGVDLNLNFRALAGANFNLFLSRRKDQFSQTNNSALFFFTWTFGAANHLLSGLRDIQNSSSRLGLVRDNHNKLYSPRLALNLEESETLDKAELDTQIKMPFAEVGARLTGSKVLNEENKESQNYASLRFAQAIVFAYNEGSFGLGVSRPVRNSFALFRPSQELKNQNISLRSTSVYPESRSGFFGELTATGLTPYQYREIVLDPTHLDHGLSLEKERFIIYPTYKSAHLIPLRDAGIVIVQGLILDQNEQAFSLKAGEINGIAFFTDRQGRFYIEGLAPGEYQMKIQGSDDKINVVVNPESRGVIHLLPFILNRVKNDF